MLVPVQVSQGWAPHPRQGAGPYLHVGLGLQPVSSVEGEGPRLAGDWRASPTRNTCTRSHKHTSLVPAAMVELDGDDVRISSRGKLAERDIVQVKQALPFSSASNRKAP